ncbi:MAG: hypothetical protein HOH02_01220 [Oceanospirillaceae bacterium]|jgi:hypothetical protein|nr:hypothetical protein [Oceanospirillaceae bacterium]MBT4443200.1 hypothetical protein [Oceanospirillaceae bacterium]MBT6076567.1 hypothetical protein [Oceanospirillaceae bacterium]MBT7331339.1 hypothetical protein [Oceanospirillaceae bacterium]
MSDQDTQETETAAAEPALELEMVSVEQAEEEAAEARAVMDPAQQELEQQVADQLADVLQDTDLEETKDAAMSVTTVDQAPLMRPLRPPSGKASADEDVLLFGDEDDDLLVDDGPVESAREAQTVESEVEDDGFIVVDDNDIDSSVDAVDEKLASASDIEGLTEIVLDAAGAANEAAHSTNQSIHMLLGSVTTINKMAKDLRKTNTYVLGLIITLGLVGLLSGAAMLYVLQGAVKDATAISIAMGTKVIQFERQMDRVKVVESQLLDVADVNHQLGQRLEQVMHHVGKVGTQAQQAASQQSAENQLMLGSVNEQIVSSFADLQKTSKAQQAVLMQLQKRINGLESQMKKIHNQDLVGKMQALIALEQERYLDLERAKLALEQAQFEAQQKADASPVEDTYITYGTKSE